MPPSKDMATQEQLARSITAEWLEDWNPLAEQPGLHNGHLSCGTVPSLVQPAAVIDAEGLRQFLADYHDRIMVPVELPAIHRARTYASRNEVREIIALDRELAERDELKPFAVGSRRAGQSQLEKLRPLRGERVLQRYSRAVFAGEACGWHTVVFGITMAIYSLPLRQSLLAYAEQTTRGFLQAGAKRLCLSNGQCRGLIETLCARIPANVERMLRTGELGHQRVDKLA
jgi:urease accessory protein UreF